MGQYLINLWEELKMKMKENFILAEYELTIYKKMLLKDPC